MNLNNIVSAENLYISNRDLIFIELAGFYRTELFGNYAELNQEYFRKTHFRTLSDISRRITTIYILNIHFLDYRCRLDKKLYHIYFTNSLFIILGSVDNYQTP